MCTTEVESPIHTVPTADRSNVRNAPTQIRFDSAGPDSSAVDGMTGSDAVAPRPLKYDLISFISHHGGLSSGHYTTFSRHRISGEWLEYDDSQTYAVPEDAIQQQEAYILYYQRRPPEPNPDPLQTPLSLRGGDSGSAEGNELVAFTPPTRIRHPDPAPVTEGAPFVPPPPIGFAGHYKPSMVDVDVRITVYVSRYWWLRRRLLHIRTYPPNAFDLMCEHGNIRNELSSKIHRAVKPITLRELRHLWRDYELGFAAAALHGQTTMRSTECEGAGSSASAEQNNDAVAGPVRFTRRTVLNSLEPCTECTHQAAQLRIRRETERQRVTSLDSETIPPGEYWNLVSKPWLTRWTAFIYNGTAHTPYTIPQE